MTTSFLFKTLHGSNKWKWNHARQINIQQSQPELSIFIKVIRATLIEKLTRKKKRKEIARSGQSSRRKLKGNKHK